MAKGQFTYRAKDGTEYDLTPHMKFRDGAYESPTRAFPRIIKEKFPHLNKEYSEYRKKAEERMAKLDKVLKKRRNA